MKTQQRVGRRALARSAIISTLRLCHAAQVAAAIQPKLQLLGALLAREAPWKEAASPLQQLLLQVAGSMEADALAGLSDEQLTALPEYELAAALARWVVCLERV